MKFKFPLYEIQKVNKLNFPKVNKLNSETSGEGVTTRNLFNMAAKVDTL